MSNVNVLLPQILTMVHAACCDDYLFRGLISVLLSEGNSILGLFLWDKCFCFTNIVRMELLGPHNVFTIHHVRMLDLINSHFIIKMAIVIPVLLICAAAICYLAHTV